MQYCNKHQIFVDRQLRQRNKCQAVQATRAARKHANNGPSSLNTASQPNKLSSRPGSGANALTRTDANPRRAERRASTRPQRKGTNAPGDKNRTSHVSTEHENISSNIGLQHEKLLRTIYKTGSQEGTSMQSTVHRMNSETKLNPLLFLFFTLPTSTSNNNNNIIIISTYVHTYKMHIQTHAAVCPRPSPRT